MDILPLVMSADGVKWLFDASVLMELVHDGLLLAAWSVVSAKASISTSV